MVNTRNYCTLPLEVRAKFVFQFKYFSIRENLVGYCSVPKNRPNYVDSQSHKKYL